jgi:RCC1 and BTB domain-containing protein
VTGHGESYVLLPRLLRDLSSKGVVSVSASTNDVGSAAACITKAGEVFTWGNKTGCGKFGHDTINQRIPKRVEALVGVKATMVSCGYNHTVVCKEDGHVYTFGEGKHGKLGHGDKENKTSPSLVVLALEGKHITQVQCGYDHTMALTSSGYVFTWGNAANGALGHGNVKLKCFSFPCLVEGLREHNIVQISSGHEHCAVLVDP